MNGKIDRRSAARAACALALVLTCSTLATAAHATGVQTMDTVDVLGSSRSLLGVADTASEGTMGGAGLRARPVLRPGELLEVVPGLIVTQHSGEGKANQYFLRGFNLDHGTDLAIYVDGMPVNMRTHGHGQGYADLSFLIPELIGRADYKKGPYFADEGDFSAAGVARLSLVDRLPENITFASVGSFGYRRVLIAGSPGDAATKLVYALDYTENNGPWTRPDNLGKFNGVLRYASGDAANGFSVGLMGYRGQWSATDQIPRRAVDDGTLGRLDTIDRSDGGRAERYSWSGQWRRTTASKATRASAYLIRSKLSLFSNFTYFLNDPVNGDQFEQLDRRTLGGVDLSHMWLGKWGARPMQNTIGLQTRHDDIRVGLFNTLERSRTSTTREDRIDESSTGLYVQNRIDWTSWFRSTVGVRGDAYRAKIASGNAANSGKARDSIVSPKASVAFGPWVNTELYASWGRGFHSNDARGATITVDPASGAPASRVPFLVRATGQEIGVRSVPIRGLELTAALFQLDSKSELVFVGDAGTTEASRASRRVGIETTLRYTPQPWLRFDLDYAQTRARFLDDDPAGRFIPGAPDRVIALRATVDSIGPWSAGVALRHFGARPLIEDNSVRSRSTTLLSGKLGYRLTKQLRFELAGFNLLNRKDSQIDYFYQSRLRGEPAAVSDVHFHPAEPRSIRVAAIAAF